MVVLLGKWVSRWLTGADDTTVDTKDAQIDTRPEGVQKHNNTGDKQNLSQYSLSEVADHSTYDNCWIILWDLVLDITSFVDEHPGAPDIILENAGRDATTVFCDVGHSKDALDMLGRYVIGILPKEERLYLAKNQQ